MTHLTHKALALYQLYDLLLQGDDITYTTMSGAQEIIGQTCIASRTTIASWQEDFESNDGFFSPSRLGDHVETWMAQSKTRLAASQRVVGWMISMYIIVPVRILASCM